MSLGLGRGEGLASLVVEGILGMRDPGAPFPYRFLVVPPFSLYAEPLQGPQLHPTSTSFWVLIEL